MGDGLLLYQHDWHWAHPTSFGVTLLRPSGYRLRSPTEPPARSMHHKRRPSRARLVQGAAGNLRGVAVAARNFPWMIQVDSFVGDPSMD